MLTCLVATYPIVFCYNSHIAMRQLITVLLIHAGLHNVSFDVKMPSKPVFLCFQVIAFFNSSYHEPRIYLYLNLGYL